MLPLRDDVPSRTMPIVTVVLIALNLLVFVYQLLLQLGDAPDTAAGPPAFVLEFGLIPCRITGHCGGAADFPSPVATVFTSMFLHGGLFHILANMLYLWIFGDNVEDTLGHGRFVLFYLGAGAAAAMTQAVVNPASEIPMIGASGAVSGVLAAYLTLFPRAGILTLVVFGFFTRLVRIPAVIVLGLWVAVQVVTGLITFNDAAADRTVAWFAHVGGFGAGLALLFLLRPRSANRL
jgi:membrane associated rhomboid family serine protease